MTIIKATCPTCGEVDLTADKVELRVGSGAAAGTYGFECPVCISWVSKPADARIIQLLISGGVRPEMNELEQAGPEEAVDPDRPPFTYDDLLDFHLQLQAAETLDALIGSRRS